MTLSNLSRYRVDGRHCLIHPSATEPQWRMNDWMWASILVLFAARIRFLSTSVSQGKTQRAACSGSDVWGLSGAYKRRDKMCLDGVLLRFEPSLSLSRIAECRSIADGRICIRFGFARLSGQRGALSDGESHSRCLSIRVMHLRLRLFEVSGTACSYPAC